MSYPKIFRISVPDFSTTLGKHYLSLDETKILLSGTVVIEEKIDGKIDDILVRGNTIFFEYMKYRHNIPYLNLPSWQIAFDVWDGSMFLNLSQKRKFLKGLGYNVVRLIFYGKTSYEELLKFLPKILALKSAYGEELIEGIVIKNYKEQLFGKIVNPKFEEEIDDGGKHWTKKPIVLNRLTVK